MLIRLIYSSTDENITEDDLAKILRSSNQNNPPYDITGMLLFGGSKFVQVLEGPRENVKKLYAKIAQDPRHKNAELLLEESIEDRVFDSWAMAYSTLTADDIKKIGGNLGFTDAASLISFIEDHKSYVGTFITNCFKKLIQ